MEMPQSQPASSVQAPSANAPEIQARLERIETSLATLNKQLEASDILTEKKESLSNKTANKSVVAGMFGLVGLKLGAAIGGKLGFFVDLGRAFRRGGKEAVSDLFGEMLTLGNWKKGAEAGLTKNLRFTTTGLAVGTILGPILGATIGWTRGDRLSKPGDLFAHPIDSLKKIFGPAPKKHPAPSESSVAPAAPTTEHHVTAAQHEGLLAAPQAMHQR